MKVLHVIAEMDPVHGGVCQAVRTIIQSMAHSGIQHEVVSLDDPTAAFLNKDPFKVHALGRARNPWAYSSNLNSWLEQNIDNYNSVIVHGLWLYPSYAVFKVLSSRKKLKRPQFSVMPHGMLDPYFQQAKGRKLKALRNWIFWKFIENKVVNDADFLLFTCEEERRLASISFNPYRPKKEIILGLGVESPPAHTSTMDNDFYERRPELAGQSFFLFLSRIHEKKGLKELIPAYEKLVRLNNESCTTTPALVIAGPGLDTDFAEDLKKEVNANSNLIKKVFFTGMLTGNEKWGAFYNSDVFVLPSHQENFGIAVAEALACSKPVLISNQINIWREIKTEKAGLVEDDNLEGTFILLKAWLSLTTFEKIHFSKNALNCYRKHYAIPALAENWKNFLNQPNN